MIKPYYEEPNIKIYQRDALEVMKDLPENSIDLIVTDPPYALISSKAGFHRGKGNTVFSRTGKGGFMGKEWDSDVPSVEIWKQCLRILKDGAFAFVMCSPRQDSLGQMIMRLGEAGFNMGFTSIYWAYASGFPKASNIGLAIDKQECKKQLTEKLGRKPTKEEFKKEWKGFRKVVDEGYNMPDLRDVGRKSKEIIGIDKLSFGQVQNAKRKNKEITTSATPQSKLLNGSYGGFQPKPAVEVIIVAMKPLSEKTYVDQALKNKKGITWFDDCRIPYGKEIDKRVGTDFKSRDGDASRNENDNQVPNKYYVQMYKNQGRFPANLLVSDDVLNIPSKGALAPVKSGQKGFGGIIYGKYKTGGDNGKSFYSDKEKKPYSYAGKSYKVKGFIQDNKPQAPSNYNDSGSFSRYFDLDKWAQKTFPFLIVPKASKSEKNKGCENLKEGELKEEGALSNSPIYYRICANCGKQKADCKCGNYQLTKPVMRKNYHPTVKPIKLMSYLITLGSRPNDIVLDLFLGSATTLISCKYLNRKGIGIEISKEYCDIAVARLKAINPSLPF